MSCSFIDSHTHMQDPAYDEDRDEILQKVRSKLSCFVWVGYDIPSSQKALKLRKEGEPVAVGVHPENATGSIEELRNWEELYQQADAVGEIGLDAVHSDVDPDDQLLWMRRQLEIAFYYGKPVIIHEREAFQAVMDVLDHYKIRTPIVFHCFSHGESEAKAVLRKGFFLSFTANITYPKADAIRSALKVAPTDHMLLETDSPYLPPQIIRGKRNDPTYIEEVYKKAAEVKALPLEFLVGELCNTFRFVFPSSAT